MEPYITNDLSLVRKMLRRGVDVFAGEAKLKLADMLSNEILTEQGPFEPKEEDTFSIMKEKGARGGLCNMEACLEPGAWHYNRGSLAWYCTACAKKPNWHNSDVKFEDGRPMVVHVPESASEEEVEKELLSTRIKRDW